MSRRGDAAAAAGGAALRVLLLEDVPADAELVLRRLAGAGLAVESRSVASEEGFRRELAAFAPDVVLADYSLPGFDGLAALALTRELRPDLPFLFVSGAIGEEMAIETLKRGATDYVLKDRLSRLVPSLERALREAAGRRERRQAQTALRRSEERHRVLLEVANALAGSLDREPLLTAIARALGRVRRFERLALALASSEAGAGGLLAFRRDGARRRPGAAERAMVEHAERHRSRLARGEALHLGTLDAAASPTAAALGRLGIASYAAVGLAGKRGGLGILAVASATPDHYGAEEAALLAQVGQQVALAVDNMLAYEEIAGLKARLEEENLYLKEEVQRARDGGEILGDSPAIRRVLAAVDTVAPTDASVLITGETGTGKELVARAIHRLSRRREGPLVRVNCAALSPTLIESELFGHEKGAFTGALDRRLGRFELADGGTLFLDEIGDLPPELQVKLLRALQEGEIERLGGSDTLRVDVRVIAATHHDLEAAVAEGRFRADLYYRLAVFPIAVPPLRERRGDVALLTRHFAAHAAERLGKTITTVPRRTQAALTAYGWPGNVRELRNVVERAVILSPGPGLELGDWAPRPAAGPLSGVDLRPLDEVQSEHIRAVLEATGWRVSGPHGAARILGLKPTTLESRMKKLGIRRNRSAR